MVFNSTDEAYTYLVKKAEELGYTKSQLADKMGIFPQAISNNLKRKGIKLKTVKDLADFLEMKIEFNINPI